MDISLRKSVTYDDNQQYIESKCNSINDTGTTKSKDGDNKNISSV